MPDQPLSPLMDRFEKLSRLCGETPGERVPGWSFDILGLSELQTSEMLRYLTYLESRLDQIIAAFSSRSGLVKQLEAEIILRNRQIQELLQQLQNAKRKLELAESQIIRKRPPGPDFYSRRHPEHGPNPFKDAVKPESVGDEKERTMPWPWTWPGSGAERAMDHLKADLKKFVAMRDMALPTRDDFHPYLYHTILTGHEVIDIVRYVAYLESALAHERSNRPTIFPMEPEANSPSDAALSPESREVIDQIIEESDIGENDV